MPDPIAPGAGGDPHRYLQAVDEAGLRDRLRALPGPRNRLHAPEAMAQADAQVLHAFVEAGWDAQRHPFELVDVWTSIDHGDFRRPAHRPRLAGANIVGIKPGAHPREAVVVVAHHDTVRDSPGADDNGASVVALTELAGLLGGVAHQRTVILAAVDMEELGLIGSRQLVRELAAEWDVVDAFVYETMAYTACDPGSQRLPPGFGLVYREQTRRLAARGYPGDFTTVIHRRARTATASRLAAALEALEGRDAAILVPDPTELPVVGRLLRWYTPLVGHFGRSDHRSFWEVGLPAVWITDTAEFRNPNYHRPSDLPDTIDYRRLAAIVAATAATIDAVAVRTD